MTCEITAANPEPTAVTVSPTEQPTNQPSINPTDEPTKSPTEAPSARSPVCCRCLAQSTTAGGTAECQLDTDCRDIVCTIGDSRFQYNPDPYCCNNRWDGVCVNEAQIICNDNILPTSATTGQPTTAEPSLSPSTNPSSIPTNSPTTAEPSLSPSAEPSVSPSKRPSESLSATPTTAEPSLFPTAQPSENPSESPSETPTAAPTTSEPSISPSKTPSDSPTTAEPSMSPSRSPSESPSSNPSSTPSAAPTTLEPSDAPTQRPSISPIDANPVCCQCLTRSNTAGGTAECQLDTECQNTVCVIGDSRFQYNPDPYCCNNRWDAICAREALIICNDNTLNGASSAMINEEMNHEIELDIIERENELKAHHPSWYIIAGCIACVLCICIAAFGIYYRRKSKVAEDLTPNSDVHDKEDKIENTESDTKIGIEIGMTDIEGK